MRAEQQVELRDSDGTIARSDWAEHHVDSGEIFMGGAQGREVTLIDGGNILRGTSLRWTQPRQSDPDWRHGG